MTEHAKLSSHLRSAWKQRPRSVFAYYQISYLLTILVLCVIADHDKIPVELRILAIIAVVIKVPMLWKYWSPE